MYGDALPSCPGITKNAGLRHIQDLFDNVQLTETIGAIHRRIKNCAVLFIGVANGAQPIINQSESCAVQCRSNAAAPVVPADNHITNVKHIDGVLQDGEAVQICMQDEICDVPMHK